MIGLWPWKACTTTCFFFASRSRAAKTPKILHLSTRGCTNTGLVRALTPERRCWKNRIRIRSRRIGENKWLRRRSLLSLPGGCYTSTLSAPSFPSWRTQRRPEGLRKGGVVTPKIWGRITSSVIRWLLGKKRSDSFTKSRQVWFYEWVACIFSLATGVICQVWSCL